MLRKSLLRPDRLRAIERPFGWLPCRLLTAGWLPRIEPSAQQLYLLLALAADRRGLSAYGDLRIQKALNLTPAALDDARAQLIHLDLLAFDRATYQLLSSPAELAPPLHRLAPTPNTPLTQQQPKICTDGNNTSPLHHDVQRHAPIPQEARRALRRLLGRDFG